MRERGAATCTCPARVGEQTREADTCAVIVAGGVGLRFGDPRGKQYVTLCGMPLMCWPLLALDRAPSIGHIVIVCSDERRGEVRDAVLTAVSLRHQVTLAPAGATRQDSVYSGLQAVPSGYQMVAIHDAARPLVTTEDVETCIAALRNDPSLGGAICAARTTDTLKLVEGQTIVATPDRSYYWNALTPQVFRTATIRAAHRAARWDAYQGTDDASLIERRGGRVLCVETSRANIKVTVPEDYVIAQALMERRLMSEGCGLDDVVPQGGDVQ